MGYSEWKDSDWTDYKASNNITSQSTVSTLYKSRSMKDNLNPYGVKYRESCDSAGNPDSRAIIIGFDVTGSMDYLAEEIGINTLSKFVEELYDKRPIAYPHLMFMAIGDAYTDSAPLQVTQFETDIKIAEQLHNIYFEGCGGGNNGESYLAAWYFAARHTKIDCLEKRGEKGILITIGDEPNHKYLKKNQIKEIFGDDVDEDLSAEQLLNEVTRGYEVFHFLVGNYEYHDSLDCWRKLLGERAMIVTDHTKIPEIIEAILEVLIGRKDVDQASAQWDGSTQLVVKTAIGGLATANKSGGLVEF